MNKVGRPLKLNYQKGKALAKLAKAYGPTVAATLFRKKYGIRVSVATAFNYRNLYYR